MSEPTSEHAYTTRALRADEAENNCVSVSVAAIHRNSCNGRATRAVVLTKRGTRLVAYCCDSPDCLATATTYLNCPSNGEKAVPETAIIEA